MKEAAKVCKEENARIAELIGINKAARTTTVKPSGCMEATTKIKTNLGVISLEEIFKVNEYDIDEFKEKNNIWLNPTQKIYVKDKNNDDKLITKLYVNGVINDLIMIEFENGDVVKVTPNHKFLTKDNGWVRADELTENHEIINY
jgi:intein/homing endonuclease